MAKEKKAEAKAADKQAEGVEIKTYKVPAGERRAGMWTFSVNGKQSHYYSSNEHGLTRTVRALLLGKAPGTVTLKAEAVKGQQKLGTRAAAKEEDPNAWADLPTATERVEAFLNRGRLKDGVLHQWAQNEDGTWGLREVEQPKKSAKAEK